MDNDGMNRIQGLPLKEESLAELDAIQVNPNSRLSYSALTMQSTGHAVTHFGESE